MTLKVVSFRGVVKTCDGFGCVLNEPSPKLQMKFVGLPIDVFKKFTLNGEQPVLTDVPNAAIGVGLTSIVSK
jgi:hypothetical protein